MLQASPAADLFKTFRRFPAFLFAAGARSLTQQYIFSGHAASWQEISRDSRRIDPRRIDRAANIFRQAALPLPRPRRIAILHLELARGPSSRRRFVGEKTRWRPGRRSTPEV